MNNLLTSIFTAFSGSSFSSDVGGRIYLDDAQEEAEFPYCVVSIVSDIPNNVFYNHGEDVIVQFSLFSSSSGATEITNMYKDLKTLFDDVKLFVVDNDMVIMRRVSTITTMDDTTVGPNTVRVRHWAVDYEVIMFQSDEDYNVSESGLFLVSESGLFLVLDANT